MKLTKKNIEKKYNCQLLRDNGFDDSHLFWTAYPNNEDIKENDWDYADGWTLAELVENIETQLCETEEE